MNSELANLIKDFIDRHPSIDRSGKVTARNELAKFDLKWTMLLPTWYIDLLTTYPIAGAEITVPFHFGQLDLKAKPIEGLPRLTITMNDLSTTYRESVSAFPGCELISDKYLCIARDEFTTGEGIYINLAEDDPGMVLVFHDKGKSNEELIRSAEKILDRFSDLFRIGEIEN
jgi:hypothetical protein